MSPALDERRQNILYHALGADFERGLPLFETAFEEAEYGFRLNEIDSLLGILADPTLQDVRLRAWHRYYKVRRAILVWRPELAEDDLETLVGEADQLYPSSELRLELLQAQILKIRGQWPAARRKLNDIVRDARGEPRIRLTAYEWLAQSLMAQAVSSGGWAKPNVSPLGRLSQTLLAFILLPAYLAIMSILGYARYLPVFRKAILRYTTNYSNWPVLLAVLEAYRALEKAQKLMAEGEENRRLQIELLRAEVLRFAENVTLSAHIYETLLQTHRISKDLYLSAVLNLGLARVRLMEGRTNEDLASRLVQARQTFSEFNDLRSIAFVDILLGDIDIRAGLPELAVEKWKTAMQAFQDQGDPAGISLCLGSCYRALSMDLSEEQRRVIDNAVQGAQSKSYSLRLPAPFFKVLQNITWLIPLFGSLGLFAWIGAYLAAHERSEYRLLAYRIFSVEGLLIGFLALIILISLAAILGLIGLLKALRSAASRLDWFTVDKDLLKYQHTSGAETSVALKDCRKIIVVERAIGSAPSDSLSYTLLESVTGSKLAIPGSTSWYRYLQESVIAASGIRPSVYRLKLYGGIIFVFIVSIFPIFFLLIDLSLQPWLTVAAHANLVTVGQILSVLLILWVSLRWFRHFADVFIETNPPSHSAGLIGSMAIALILVSLFGRRQLFPFGAIVLAWGIVLLVALLSLLSLTWGNRSIRQVARAGSYLVIVVGFAAVLYSLVPLLLHTQAYVYGGAIQKQEPASPGYQLERAEYFAKMGARSRQILQLDPSYRQAYGLLGLALQGQGDYENSLRAYATYYELTGSTDILHCKALVHYVLGEQEEASHEYNMYLAGKEDPSGPDYCDRYFPELQGALDRLE